MRSIFPLLRRASRGYATIAVFSCAFLACFSEPDDDGRLVAPACTSPAWLSVPKSGTPTDDYVVMLEKGTPDAEADELARRHRFVVATRLSILPGFSTTLHPRTVAELRCEPAVVGITESRRVIAIAR